MVAYATRAQFYVSGLPAAVCAQAETKSPGCVELALENSSRFMDSFFRVAYQLPLLQWGSEVTRACCHIAAPDVIDVLGSAPGGADERYDLRSKAAQQWLDKVAMKRAFPELTEGSISVDGAVVVSQPSREWDDTPCDFGFDDLRAW